MQDILKWDSRFSNKHKSITCSACMYFQLGQCPTCAMSNLDIVQPDRLSELPPPPAHRKFSNCPSWTLSSPDMLSEFPPLPPPLPPHFTENFQLDISWLGYSRIGTSAFLPMYAARGWFSTTCPSHVASSILVSTVNHVFPISILLTSACVRFRNPAAALLPSSKKTPAAATVNRRRQRRVTGVL